MKKTVIWIYSIYPPRQDLELTPEMDIQKQCGNIHSSDNQSSSSACGRGFLRSFGLKKDGEGLVSRFQKYCLRIFMKGVKKGKLDFVRSDPMSLVAISADMSAKAMVKILKKCSKVDGSRKEFQKLQIQGLKLSCLCELMAFYMNVEEKRHMKKTAISGLLDECKFHTSEEGSSSLSISATSDSRDVDVDLNCSICLDTIFDPVCLGCGHMFCYMCACSAASVTSIDGVKAADSTAKCPLCRKEGVFEEAERMFELHKLLKRKLPEYWKDRREKERRARMEEAKEYWESQCRAVMGIR